MNSNVKLLPNQGEPLSDPEKYRRLVGKLNYLTITRPDISFAISVVSQFLNSPCEDHWNAVIHIVKYIKGSLGKELLYGHNNHTKFVCYSDVDGQDLHLIEDKLLVIVSPLVITWSLGRIRNKVLWQDLVQKQNIELWPRLLVTLFDLISYLKNYNLEKSLKWNLYVIIRLFFILAQIQFFMTGPNILRLIVISFEKRLYQKISRLSLLIQIIN